MTTPKNTLKLPIEPDRVYRHRDSGYGLVFITQHGPHSDFPKNVGCNPFSSYDPLTGKNISLHNNKLDLVEGPFVWDEVNKEWVLEVEVQHRFDYILQSFCKAGVTEETHHDMSETDIENIVNEEFNAKPNLLKVDIYKKHASYSRVTKIERTDV